MLEHKAVSVPWGALVRHPTEQRKAQPKKWASKCGEFRADRNTSPIHIVAAESGIFHVVDGGHRVEAYQASRGYDPNTKAECWLWGNGNVPTKAELNELFLLLNFWRLEVGAGTAFEKAFAANEADALFVKEQKDRLGARFRTTTTVWSAARRDGRYAVTRTIDFLIDVWPQGEITRQIFSGAHELLKGTKTAKRLNSRRRVLKAKTPLSIVNEAQLRQFRIVGRRPPISYFIKNVLLGQR